MLVSIEDSVFSDPEYFDELRGVLEVFREGLHEWTIEDATVVEESAWYSADQGQFEQFKMGMIEKAFSAGKYPNEHLSKMCRIVPDDSAEADSIPVKGAAGWLRVPLFVVVENGVSDRKFLRFFFVGLNRRDLDNATTDGRIEFINAGGIEGIRAQAGAKIEDLAEKHGEYCRQRIRMFVVMDSDSKYPGHSPQQNSDAVNFCKEFAIPFRILQWRIAENYLPDELIKDFCNKDQILEAYFSLSFDQQKHYHLRDGYQKDTKNTNKFRDAEQERFLSAVNRETRDALFRGFGNINEQFATHKENAGAHDIQFANAEMSVLVEEISSLL